MTTQHRPGDGRDRAGTTEPVSHWEGLWARSFGKPHKRLARVNIIRASGRLLAPFQKLLVEVLPNRRSTEAFAFPESLLARQAQATAEPI